MARFLTKMSEYFPISGSIGPIVSGIHLALWGGVVAKVMYDNGAGRKHNCGEIILATPLAMGVSYLAGALWPVVVPLEGVGLVSWWVGKLQKRHKDYK